MKPAAATPRKIACLALAAAALALAACGSGDGGGGVPARSGKIAFVSFRDGNQEIYLVNADGTQERNLTNHPGDDFDPDLSPDGTTLAFVSNRGGDVELYAMELASGQVRRVTDGPAQAPRWSNDGRRIAYSSAGSIAVVEAGGLNKRIVLEVSAQGSGGAECRTGSFPGGWSPDDSQITYYAASLEEQVGQVCIVKADGGDVRTLVAEPGEFDVEPVWSPDGKEIMYRAIKDDVHDIWVVDVSSGKRTNLTDDPELDVEPAWSPDGRWIVFASLKQNAPNFDLYLLPRAGGEQVRLTRAQEKDAYPSWAP